MNLPPVPADAVDLAAEAAASLGGSLLQYVAANDPWVEGDAVPRECLDDLAARQRGHARALAEHVRGHHRRPEPPSFADAFATYHYVSFAWLVPRITEDAATRLEALKEDAESLRRRPEAAGTRAVLLRVIESEEAVVAALAELTDRDAGVAS